MEPFYLQKLGEGQPGDGDDEDYVHITGTNMEQSTLPRGTT